MAKKSKSNDFAFFLGSELQETAARMRKINSAASAEAAAEAARSDTASDGERSFQQVLLDALRSEASHPGSDQADSPCAVTAPIPRPIVSPDIADPVINCAPSIAPEQGPATTLPEPTGADASHTTNFCPATPDDTCSDTQVSSGVISMTPVQTLRCHQVSSPISDSTPLPAQESTDAVPPVFNTLPYSRPQERLKHVSTSSPDMSGTSTTRPAPACAEHEKGDPVPEPLRTERPSTKAIRNAKAASGSTLESEEASCLDTQVSSGVINDTIDSIIRCHQVSSGTAMTPDDTSVKTVCSGTTESLNPEQRQNVSTHRTPSGALLRVMLALAERREADTATVNLKHLAVTLGLSHGTVRNIMSRLTTTGCIRTVQVRIAEAHGVLVRFTPSFEAELFKVDPALRCHQVSSGVIDAFSASIWDADETLIRDLWPHAAQAGLEPAHLQQLSRAFHVQGWRADAVALYLRYLDWSLRVGGDISLAGWLEQMRRQGFYPKPEHFPE